MKFDRFALRAFLQEQLRQLRGQLRFLKAWFRQQYEHPPHWKTVLRYSGLAFLMGGSLLVGFCALVYFGAFGPVPTYADLRQISNHTASEVYSADGILLGKYYVENRVNADFEEIPSNLINALVATEDARFFEHDGIDPRALARVAVRTILLADRSGGGGSTISQQLAKNLYPRQTYPLLTVPINKVREMFVARRLEKIYTKEQLLRLYLNTVPFGENIFGVKVAARRFFNKAPSELRTEEAAVLVGMLKGTTYYSPARHPDRAELRRNTVLRQMSRYGYLSPQESDSLQRIALQVDYQDESHSQGLATYFRAHLQQELEDILSQYSKPDGSPFNLYTDGLRIYTSIDSRLQQYAEEATRETMAEVQQKFYREWRTGTPWGADRVLQRAIQASPQYQQLQQKGLSEEAIQEELNKPRPMQVFDWDPERRQREMSVVDSVKHYLTLLNAGFLAADPRTGLIKAWVGGIDFRYVQYDHVKAQRQIGSTFKPIVYAEALRQGRQPCQFIPNERHVYEAYEDWSPRNSDGNYEGYYSMQGGLANSVNTVTVELMMDSGVDAVRNLATGLGLPSDMHDGPAIALGAVDASLYQVVRAYAAFANGGKLPRFHYLDRIETSDGQLIAEFQRPNPSAFRQALPEQVNNKLVHMLQSVVDSGTARRLRYQYGIYQELAGKTGTTQNQSDGWFIGFTPDLVAGAWVGAELPAVHFRSLYTGQGSSTALPIYGRFMRSVVRDKNYRKWRRSSFPALPDTTLASMACPLYLEEIPLVDELLQEYFENPGFFERLYDDLENGYDRDAPIQLKPRRNRETREEYLERMRRYNERLERREERRQERKAFFGELLFGKMKEEQERKEREAANQQSGGG